MSATLTRPRLHHSGDSLVLVEFEPRMAPEVNARVVALAQAIVAARVPGVRDVVPGYAAAGVHVDPLHFDASALEQVVAHAWDATGPEPAAARVTEIPVCYGGPHGPDLEAVAAFAGCSPDEVAQRHAAETYRVYMLGFLPGFAYLGSVAASIAMPRRSAPRERVPAGSVGIAGLQTGVYPCDSPGGWQLIGRTPWTHVRGDQDGAGRGARRRPRALPAGAGRGVGRPGGRALAMSAAAALTVLRPGLLTTVQDLGRWGSQALGVPVSGAMDSFSHRLANALVGNAAAAATLEVTLLGPELRAERPLIAAVAGAEFTLTVDGRPVPHQAPFAIASGAVLRFGARHRGSRAYLAVAGGVDTPLVLGSRSTHLVSAMGGLDGRALISGDVLPVAAGEPAGLPREGRPLVRTATPSRPRLRVLLGPQDAWFSRPAIETLLREEFRVSTRSNRMGFRLDGPSLAALRQDEPLSEPVPFGALQVPAGGAPILLMADRQTAGGYPKIATVITADLPLAGQLGPGDVLTFTACTRAEARAALIARERELLRAMPGEARA